MFATHDNFISNELYTGYQKPDSVNKIIGSIIDNWYYDIDKPVVIDKNRAWCARVPFIEGYIKQEAKIIVPVRRVDEILASILTMIKRNPFQEGQPRINFVDEYLVKNNIPINDETRCRHLLNSDGIIWESLNATKMGVDEGYSDKFHYVDYNDLVTDPQGELNKIYNFLDEEPFEHTFDNLSNQHREDDLTTYGLNDMHEVHKKIEKRSQNPNSVIPDSIIELYNMNKKTLEFWKIHDTMEMKPNIISPNNTNNYNLFSR
jgi:sulfotransferase